MTLAQFVVENPAVVATPLVMLALLLNGLVYW